MATTVVHTIGTTGDYATLAAWWTAQGGANLVTADEVRVAEMLAETHTSSIGAMLAMSTGTTDATRYYVIRAAYGGEFDGDVGNISGKTILTNAAGLGQGITCSVAYTRFEGLIFDNWNLTPISVSGTNCLVDWICVTNIAIGAMVTAIIAGLQVAGNGTIVKNCVINKITGNIAASFGSKGITVYGISGLLSQTASCYNNTVANITASGVGVGAVSAIAYGIAVVGVAKNNLVMLVSASGATTVNTATDIDIATITTEDYNATEDGSDTSANSITITPSSEVTDTSAATFDCHLIGGASCLLAGDDLSAIFTDDVDGDTRPAGYWDIGADQVSTAPGGGWSGKIYGIASTDIDTVDGVDIADIDNIN